MTSEPSREEDQVLSVVESDVPRKESVLHRKHVRCRLYAIELNNIFNAGRSKSPARD